MMAKFVTMLNEYSQKTRSRLRFEDVGSDGPDHIKTFSVRVVLNDKEYPEGVGKNKKEAKQKAAENALRALGELGSPVSETTVHLTPPPSTTGQFPITQLNYVCWLNEYGHQRRVNVKAVESMSLGAMPCCRFEVGDQKYPEAVGKSKREAKEEAAKLVYYVVCGSEESGMVTSTPVNQAQVFPNVKEPNVSDVMKGLSSLTFNDSQTETNYIGLINDYCQKNRLPNTFILENKHGPSHGPQFFYKLVISNQEYPVGEGMTAKDAKQKAAQHAWAVLQSSSGSDVSGSTPKSTEACDMCTGPRSNPPPSPGSPASSKNQSSDSKCRRRLAANFQNACRHSKDEPVTNFNVSEKTTSKFTSDFDSIDILGRGGIGHVYKARNKLLNQSRAVKIVCCDQKALREVKALANLEHPHIVRYYTCWLEYSRYMDRPQPSAQGSPPKYLYIEMELCSTKNLRSWIQKKNLNQTQKSKEEGLSVFKSIVCGVAYIHSCKFIHRDLKPENILFDRNKVVKIGDFGLVTNEDVQSQERTVYRGTPTYMAPEQKDQKNYDRKVDIFALGLIYFELLWNLPSDKRTEVWADLRKQKTPEGFMQRYHFEDLMIKQMLSVKPEERPEAKTVQEDLERSEPCERMTV